MTTHADSLSKKGLFLVWHRLPAGENAGWKPAPHLFQRPAKRATHKIGIAAWTAACIAVVLTPAARGDVIDTVWVDSSNYRYEINHMPDLDQGRIPDPPNAWGLPNNGKQYCVPTSTMNMIMYIANHGHPQLAPGPKNWQGPSTYNEASLNLVILGMKMGTSATTGTTGNGWLDGAKAWFQTSNYDHFVINHHYATQGHSPTQATITLAAINGSLVAFAYGRYETVDNISGYPVVERHGGHIVTLAKSFSSSITDSYHLWIRDPGDSAADTVQSTFGNRHLTVTNRTVVTCASPSSCATRVMSALNYAPENERTAYIDEYLSITPKTGYGFTNIGDFHLVKIFKPFLIAGSGGASLVEHAVAKPIIDAVSCLDQSCYLLLTLGGDLTPIPQLSLLDPLTGESDVLVDIAGATDLVMDPNSNVYVLADRQLVKLGRFGDTYDFTETAPLPVPGQALTYVDPVPDVVLRTSLDPVPTLVVLSITDAKVMFFSSDLSEDPTVFAVPREVLLGGEGAVAVPPLGSGIPEEAFQVWMCSEASDDLYGVEFGSREAGAVEVVSLPQIAGPTAIDFDDAAHMFVSTADGLVELARDASGQWQVVEGSDFAAFDVGSNFHAVRSRTNFDPATMTGPGFYNIDPADLELGDFIPDCPDTTDPIDSDRDGVPDSCDPCPTDNPDDSDGDGVCDSSDVCPRFDDTACDDGNECTIDSCEPCVNDAAAADGNDCVHDTGRLGVCDSGVCIEVCPNGPYTDITLLDHAAFVTCMTGPGSDTSDSGCACSDFNADGHVDLEDYNLIQTIFDGP